MKLTIKLLALFFGVLMLANIANAESPREQLKQMVEQLQVNPSDDALREKIIKLAQKMKPAPAVPDEAIEFEGRAQFAFKSAKAESDYLAAAKEYEKAISVAPWVSGYYSDLCTIYEKAGKFEEAKRNCEFSLVGLADAAQITDIKRRIAGLKYGIEQNSPEAIAARKREESAKRGLAGFWQIQSSRVVYSNPNVTQVNADGVWTTIKSPIGDTYEFRKTGDSYEIDLMTMVDRYVTKRASATTIEFGRADGTGWNRDHQCELEGEALFCKVAFSENGVVYLRQEERFVRMTTCMVGKEFATKIFSVQCR